MKLRLIALVLGLCAVASVTFLLIPSEVGAVPQNETDLTYLDADGYPVGWYFRGCDGQRIVEGVQTPYKLLVTTACSSGNSSTTCYVNTTPTACSELPIRCIFIGGHWQCH